MSPIQPPSEEARLEHVGRVARMRSSRVTFVVPTLGRSPYLSDCLESLVSAAADRTSVVIAAGPGAEPALGRLITNRKDLETEVVAVPAGAGFAGACNAALDRCRTEFVALVNDDAILGPRWADRLIEALDASSGSASAQGVNLQLSEPALVDGSGIGWNAYWQAVQIDHGVSRRPDEAPTEIFGVSATAALFRRQALDATALGEGEVFDSALNTYYEDVDLACRLRAKGFSSLRVSSASAHHAGSATSSGAERWRWHQIYGNRILVLARLFGRAFWPRLPLVWLRDSVDLGRAAAKRDGSRCLGILQGWRRALALLARFARPGPPAVPLNELRRFLQ